MPSRGWDNAGAQLTRWWEGAKEAISAKLSAQSLAPCAGGHGSPSSHCPALAPDQVSWSPTADTLSHHLHLCRQLSEDPCPAAQCLSRAFSAETPVRVFWLPWSSHCQGLVLTFLMFAEGGFPLPCALLSNRASQQVCMGLWGPYLLLLFCTLDFSAQDAHAIRWLKHGGFTYSHHGVPEIMTPSDLYARGSLSQSSMAEPVLRSLLLLLFEPRVCQMWPCVCTLTAEALAWHRCDFTLVARYRSEVSESQGLPSPNKTP